MPMKNKYLAPSLREFLESNPDLFMRCDRTGKENLDDEFWRVRENVTELKVTASIIPEKG